MGRWREVWLHLRGKKSEVEQSQGAVKDGLQREIPRAEPAFTTSGKRILFEPPTVEELDRKKVEEESKLHQVDVIQAINNCSLPDFDLAKLMLNQIFIVGEEEKSAADSWPSYTHELLTHAQKTLDALDQEHVKELEIWKKEVKKSDPRRRVPRWKKKKRADRFKTKRSAIDQYFKEYFLKVNKKIQDINIAIRESELERKILKRKLGEKTQIQILTGELSTEKLKVQNQLIDSTTTLIEKVKDALEGILTIEKTFQAVGILATYVVTIAGARAAVTSQKFKQIVVELISKVPSIEKVLGHDFIYAKWAAGTAIVLGSAGIFTKAMTHFWKKRLAKKEAKELAAQMEKIKEEVKALEQMNVVKKTERDNIIHKIIDELKKEIEDIKIRYEIMINPIKMDDALTKAIFRHQVQIAQYRSGDAAMHIEPRDERVLQIPILYVMKKMKGKVNFRIARERLLNKMNELGIGGYEPV